MRVDSPLLDFACTQHNKERQHPTHKEHELSDVTLEHTIWKITHEKHISGNHARERDPASVIRQEYVFLLSGELKKVFKINFIPSRTRERRRERERESSLYLVEKCEHPPRRVTTFDENKRKSPLAEKE
jgi:hypothetical protein